MRLLLVIPMKTARAILPSPDIGLAYVARAALDAGAQVEVLDAHKEGMGPEQFEDFLTRRSYDLIGFKCLSIDLPTVLEYCKTIRRLHPRTLTVLGGPHPSAMPRQTLEFQEVDYVLRGESEPGMASLVRKAGRHSGDIPVEELREIPGLAFRNGGGRVELNPLAFPADLDSLGFPAWHLFPIEEYPEMPGSGGRFLPIITSRGCPSLCTFCCAHVIHGHRIRRRSPAHIAREIEWLIEQYDLKRISIFDNNFTFHREHALDFCALYKQKNFRIPFDVPQGVRIDKFDADLLRTLEDAGCDYIGIGIESGSQQTLDRVRKGTRLRDIREKIDLVKRHTGMKTIGFFIIGFPHETEEDILQTIAFSLSLGIDYATFTLFTPFPGTRLFDEMLDEGYFTLEDFNWRNLLLDRTTFEHRNLSRQKLKGLQRLAYMRFYFRPSRFAFFFRILFREKSLRSYLVRFSSILRQ